MEKIFEIYCKKPAFGGDMCLVAFPEEDNKPQTFSVGSVVYDYLADSEVGEKFYTIHQEDAEGNFVEINIYFDKDEAISKAKELYEMQDEECVIPYYVIEWIVNDDGDVELINMFDLTFKI